MCFKKLIFYLEILLSLEYGRYDRNSNGKSVVCVYSEIAETVPWAIATTVDNRK